MKEFEEERRGGEGSGEKNNGKEETREKEEKGTEHPPIGPGGEGLEAEGGEDGSLSITFAYNASQSFVA